MSEVRFQISKNSIPGYCAITGRPINILNVHDKEELARIHRELRYDTEQDLKKRTKTIQILAFPILHESYLLGVVEMGNTKTGKSFTSQDESFTKDIGQALGEYFFRPKKYGDQKKPTKFDNLVRNSIITEAELAEAFSRARLRRREVESVLMSDFNVSKGAIGKSLSEYYKTRFVPFKQVNDPSKRTSEKPQNVSPDKPSVCSRRPTGGESNCGHGKS